jgi:hypothetical protein
MSSSSSRAESAAARASASVDGGAQGPAPGAAAGPFAAAWAGAPGASGAPPVDAVVAVALLEREREAHEAGARAPLGHVAPRQPEAPGVQPYSMVMAPMVAVSGLRVPLTQPGGSSSASRRAASTAARAAAEVSRRARSSASSTSRRDSSPATCQMSMSTLIR